MGFHYNKNKVMCGFDGDRHIHMKVSEIIWVEGMSVGSGPLPEDELLSLPHGILHLIISC